MNALDCNFWILHFLYTIFIFESWGNSVHLGSHNNLCLFS